MLENAIKKALYNLCIQANTQLPESVLDKIKLAYEKEKDLLKKENLANILINAQMAYDKKMALCQDTGQVLVFVKGSPKLIPENLNEIINESVKNAYEENFYRKSVVKNALERKNTKTNTPCIIYTQIQNTNTLSIELLIKGAGSENVSKTAMLSPTATENDIQKFVLETIASAGTRGCPPYFIGVGIGGTMEYAGLLSKKALIIEKSPYEVLENSIKEKCENVLDVKIIFDFTHIACMPVAVTINCHSERFSRCEIKENGEINFEERKRPEFSLEEPLKNKLKIHSSEVEKLRNLKIGDEILLSGEIYTARDMAHKRLVEMLEKGEKLPFELKDKIIFYAAPCPSIIKGCSNSIGPTTSSRMDKFTPTLYQNGLLATIGKGERSKEVEKAITDNKGIYFTAQGGVACYFSQHITKTETIAFEDLAPEAICKLEVKDIPLLVSII